MSKQTVKSLTRKGWSQKKIAKTLHMRKQKVVDLQRALKVGKRAVGGAGEFWRDVKSLKTLKEITRKEAIKEVKFAPKWFRKRQKKLKGVAKARDAMREKWQRINEGKIDPDVWKEAEGEELLDFAGYD
jgi:SOS response regulatory protein OraA/RecX